jgi:O-antigen/teichoic acid export membrane protein
MHFNKALSHSIGLRALNTGLSFVITILMVRLLGVKDSGTFFYYLTFCSLTILVLSFSLEAAITYYATKLSISNSKVLLYLLPVMLLQTILAFLLMCLVPKDNILHDKAPYFVMGNIAVSYFSALYTVRKWFTSLNVLLFVVNIGAAIALFILFLQYGYKDESTGYYISPLIFIAIPAIQAVLLLIVLLLKKNTRYQCRTIGCHPPESCF